MTRQWTGWIAWSALAIVVGIPSANLALSGSDGTGRQEPIHANQFQPQQQPDARPFFGPPPPEEEDEQAGFIGPPLPESGAPSAPESAEAPAPEPKPETGTETATAPAAETEPAAQAGAATPQQPLAPRGGGVRIVGDPGLARVTGESTGPSLEGLSADALRRAALGVHPDALAPSRPADEPVVETAANPSRQDGTAGQREPLGDPIPLPFRVGNGIAEDDIARAPVGTAATGTPDGRARVTSIAPEPMPAAMRPPEPARTSPSFEDEVRQTLADIRHERRGRQPVVPPAPGNDIDVLVPEEEEVDVLVPGEQLRGSGTLLDPYRFEPRSRSRAVTEGYAGDSEFYRRWARENDAVPDYAPEGDPVFPARRGSGVRLDLLR